MKYILPLFFVSLASVFGDEKSKLPSTLVVNVRDTGAKGDVGTDDTAAFQEAVDRVGGTGGTVAVPKGTYLINVETGVQLKSQMCFRMAEGAILKAKPTPLGNSAILSLLSVKDVKVTGGVLEGERKAHIGTTGEWGHGLQIDNSQDITITGVEAKECWGDGFYVSGPTTTRVTFSKIKADHNRRQGMSIVDGTLITVLDSEFMNTAGTLPETGIDIEPNEGAFVRDTRIQRCIFTNNAGGGIYIGPAEVDRKTTFVTGIVVEQCVFRGNGLNSIAPPAFGIRLSACSGNELKSNRIEQHTGIGIGILKTVDSQIIDNTVIGTKASGKGIDIGAGLLFEEDKDSVCTGNIAIQNAGKGIHQYQSNVKFSNNTLADNVGDLPMH